MNPPTDFDRLLGSVLEADGPQGVPPGLVDAALGEARTVGQRRPFIHVADHLLTVAGRVDGRILVKRYLSRDLQLIAWQDLGGPTQAPPSDPGLSLCLQLDAGVPAS